MHDFWIFKNWLLVQLIIAIITRNLIKFVMVFQNALNLIDVSVLIVFWCAFM